MVESSAFPSQRQTTNDTGYRRISSFAIGGLAVGLLFVLFLLLQVGAGLLTHSTVLMPLWLEAFAVLGVVLSLMGLRAISQSDGTLAGVKIAKAGIWISLVAGLGYGSYYMATYMAVRQQADAAVQQWFQKISQGKINEAFLLTLPGNQRRRANPDDQAEMDRLNNPAPGPGGAQSRGGVLDLFRYNEIIHLLQQGGTATKVTPMGVREWEEKQGVYVVRRMYDVDCPEAKFLIQVTAMGSEDPTAADKGRTWWVPFMESSVERESLRKTKLGERIDALRGSGMAFVKDWASEMHAGQLQKAYLKTLDPKQQKSSDGDAKKTPPPGFEAAYTKGGLLDFSSMRVRSPEAKEPVEQALRGYLAGGDGKMVVLNFAPFFTASKRLWSVDADNRLLFPVECKVSIGQPGGMTQFVADVVAWLQSEPGQLDSTADPSWRLTKLEVMQAATLADVDPVKSRQMSPPR